MAVGVGKMTLPSFQMKGSGISGIIATVIQQKPLPDDHPFYPLIGRIVAEWARLEHELDLIIWELAETDRAVNSCMTAQIGSYAARFEVISALAEFRKRRNKAMEKRISALKGKIGSLAKERARYIHDAWFIQSSGDGPNDTNEAGQFSNFSVTHKKFGFLPITEEKLRRFTQDIRQCAEKLSTLRTDLCGEPKP